MPKSYRAITNRLIRNLNGLRHREEGAIVVEAGLILPIMIFLFGAGLVVQDAIRVSYTNTRAVYTVADMVSREDVQINDAYFNGLESVYTYLVSTRYESELRISTIECTENCTDEDERILEVCWSKPTAGLPELTTADVATFRDSTPLFDEGDTLLLTEAYLDYEPLLGDTIIPAITYSAVTYTRPRIVGQIKYDTGNTDGFGNDILQDCFNNG